MKEVPVFIASSIVEFERERVELGDYIELLNDLYAKDGVRIRWKKPEHMSRAMRPDASQSAYDDEIRNSEFCFFIVGRNLGDYTRHEFETAWEHYQTYHKPLIVCYFLPSFASDSVVQFRKRLKELKYFYKDCADWSTLKLEMQIELTRGGAFDVPEEINNAQDYEIGRSNSHTGEKSYIFISYSHQDVKIVNPIVKAIVQAGYNIWYDERISLAKNWKNEIAEHILKCEAVIAFHSNSSSRSLHCQTELDFAISNQKTILSVYLEDNVQLSPGLKMYLQLYQSIKLSQYDVDAFIARLNEDNTFTMCKKTRKVERINQYKSMKKKPDIDAERAITCNKLANLLKEMKRFAEAEAYLREALEIRRNLAEANPDAFESDVAKSCNNLGDLLCLTNRFEEAEMCYREALVIQRMLSEK